MCACSREDVQNQGCAVEDFHFRVGDGAFKLALLGRRQLVIEDYHLRSGVCPQGNQLLNLAGTDISGWVRPVEPLFEAANHAQTGRVGKSLQLAE